MNINQLRNGMMIDLNGSYYQVMEFTKCSGGLQVKANNLISKKNEEFTLSDTASFESFYPERKKLEFSFREGDCYYFLDTEIFEEVAIDAKSASDGMRFALPGDECEVLSYNGKILTVNPPIKAVLKIKSIIKSGGKSIAILENDEKIEVPERAHEGDNIAIHTTEGKFLGFWQ